MSLGRYALTCSTGPVSSLLELTRRAGARTLADRPGLAE